MMEKQRILDELDKMTDKDLDKPIICRMQNGEDNVLTGRDLKKILGDE